MSERWQRRQMRDLLEESSVQGNTGKNAHKLTVKLYGKGVIGKSNSRPGSENTRYYRRFSGQFVYSTLDFLNGAFGVIPAALDGFESTKDLPAFDVSPSVDSDWLLRFVCQPEFYRSFGAAAIGSRKARRVNPGEFLETSILVPPLSEQKKIAAILTAVDDVIQKTQAVIDQLQVVKQAMMEELLTRGLPGRHKRFKKTEVGEIPEEWGIRQLSDLAVRITDGTHQTPKFSENGIPFLLVKSISSGSVRWDETNFVSEAVYSGLTRNWKPQAGDVLYTAVGATYGVALLVDFDAPFAFQRHIACIRPRTDLIQSRFMTHVLNSPAGKRQADLSAVGNAQPTVTLGALGAFRIPVPALEEQGKVSDSIDSVCGLIGVNRKRLFVLQVAKHALASVLLTGLVRVVQDGGRS